MMDHSATAESRKKKEKVLLHGIDIKNFWGTPYNVYDVLDREFDFDIDCAATAATAKCSNWLGLDHPEERRRNAFFISWPGRRGFLNPPYSPDGGGLDRWVSCAHSEAQEMEVMVLLVPATPDTAWAEFLWEQGAELRFTPRIAFLDPEGERTSPMGGSLVAIIRPGQVKRDIRHPRLLADAAPIIFGYAPWKDNK
jgi:phage N-6-adenine-methyltransferase